MLREQIETSSEFYQKLIRIALPVAMQSVITVGVNMIDTIMLGKLGDTALSASDLANRFIVIFVFMCMGISMGASVMTGRFWGAKDMVSLKKVVNLSYRMALGMALVFTAVNILLPGQIMSLYIKDPEVIAAGATYLRWSTVTYLLMALVNVSTNVIRSVGVNYISFVASLCSFGVNIGANYVFIFGKFGFPRMEVAGAALGTVIARVVETAIICVYVFAVDQRIRFRLRDLLQPCRDILEEFLHISVPVMLSDSLLGFGESALAMVVGHIGTQFVAANSVTNVVQRLSTIFISGLAHAGCIIITQTLGEGDRDKVWRQGNSFLLIGTVVGLVAAGFIMFFRGPVIGYYEISAGAKEIAWSLMDAISLLVVFRSVNSILAKGVIRGGGDTRFLVFADTALMWIIAIPLGAIAGLVLHLPPFWTYVCLYSDQILKTFVCVYRLRSGKWIKKIKGVTQQKGEVL